MGVFTAGVDQGRSWWVQPGLSRSREPRIRFPVFFIFIDLMASKMAVQQAACPGISRSWLKNSGASDTAGGWRNESISIMLLASGQSAMSVPVI